MDRAHNWERTDKAFQILTHRKGKKYKSALSAIKESYKKNVTDEFIKPSLIEVGPGEEGAIASNDAVIFINFRTDRPRQLVERFLAKGPSNLEYVTMTQYNPDYQVKVAFSPMRIKNSLGEIISRAGLRQLRITETEKFAHLTFFLNCKKEEAFEGEDRMMLDSYSDIKTHDERPEMRTPDIAREIIEDIRAGSHEVIFTNFCNADMIGHTGNLAAAIKGVEIIDREIKTIITEAQKKKWNIVITADHGNAEEMIDKKTGGIITSHTTNPVPFILISNKWHKLNRDQPKLQDVAPTVLKLLGLRKPKEMTGKSFI